MSDDDSPPQINLVRMGEEYVVPLGLILTSLKIMADNIRDNSYLEEIKDQLKDYKWLIGDNLDKRQLMKALAVVVNEAIQEKKIEPVDKSSEKVKEELYDLLAKDDKRKKTLRTKYLLKKVALSEDSEITSPRVLAEVSLQANAAQWVVANMIQRQFEIEWDTVSGEPDDYSFYDFCDTKNTKELFKYIPRLAHVKATLYKECRSKQQMLHELLQEPKNSLCPEVFVKTVDGWTTWKAPDKDDKEEDKEDKEDKESEFRPLTEDFSWIDPSNGGLREFIEKNAAIQKPDRESLKQSLKNPTLYWAVIKDSDFPGDEDIMRRLELKPIGQTQVYVGKTNNGIKGRWLEDSGSHCEMMKKCLDNVWAMTTYDSLRLEGIQLVDARLALAKIRGEKTALFVIKTFGNDIPEKEKNLKQLEKDLRDAKDQTNTAATPPSEANSDKALALATKVSSLSLSELEKEVDNLEKKVDNLKEELKGSKREAEDKLKKEEQWHRQGTRDGKLGIIPSGEGERSWKPTDMNFGMNAN